MPFYPMKIKYILPVFLFLFLGQCLWGQNKEYAVFRKAILELDKEYQQKRPAALTRYQNLTKSGASESAEPKVSVVGGDAAFNKALEEQIKSMLSDGKSAPSVSGQTGNVQAKEVPPPVNFTSIPMFAGEESGPVFKPNRIQEQKNEKSVIREEMVWSEPEVFVSEVKISDIKDPKEKAYWQNQADISEAAFEVNQIDFFAALASESATEKKFVSLMQELTKNKLSMDEAFAAMKALSETEQVEFIKSGIVALSEKVLQQ